MRVNANAEPAQVLGAIGRLAGWLKANAFQGYEL
jgi:hypothetical protein